MVDDDITIRQTAERILMMIWKWREWKRVKRIIKFRRTLVTCLGTERHKANLKTRNSKGLNSDLVPPEARHRRK
jgi:hypothetical protein